MPKKSNRIHILAVKERFYKTILGLSNRIERTPAAILNMLLAEEDKDAEFVLHTLRRQYKARKKEKT